MKRTPIAICSALIVIALAYGIAAAETISLTVTCTIPQIPGVNCPPFPDKGQTTDEWIPTDEKQPLPAKADERILVSHDTGESGAVATYYSR